MKIVQLQAENVKRLKAITITPNGAIVEITGRNAQGKTSVLDSIAMALGGKDLCCEKPIRKGEKRGCVTIDLGDLIVTRTFTEAGGSLTVTNKEGVKQASPQSILDRLTGKLSFDPLAFSRAESREQAATLRRLVGLDFSGIDAERQQAFTERTAVNRDVTRLESQALAYTPVAGLPAEEVSASAVIEEINQAMGLARDADDMSRNIEILKSSRVNALSRIKAIASEIEGLISKHNELEADETRLSASIKNMDAQFAALPPVDIETPQAKLKNLEAVNVQVRQNKAHASIKHQLRTAQTKADGLTLKISDCDVRKSTMLAEAAFPVEGLRFDDSGVLLNGLPFAQASAAEQLRTSVAIGMAGNPTLRVMLIRDGSLLDSDSLKVLADMTAAADYQTWIERVADGVGGGVVIEDGMVKAE